MLPPRPDDPSRYARRLLVTRFSALGDVAMTVPAIYSLCRRHPDTLVVLVTKRSVAGLFVNAPASLAVVGVDLGEYRGVRGLWRLARELHHTWQIDAYADLHDVLRTKVLRLYFATHGVPTAVIDKGRALKSRLTRSRGKELAPLPTSHSRYADTFRRLGLQCEPEADFVSLYDTRPADASLYAGVLPVRRDGVRRIGIAPFAAHRGKIYPPEQMRRVIELLVEDKVEVFLFGAGAEEAAVLDAWADELPGVYSLASLHLGWSAELSLMASLDVMLTMDSGNMHLAALTGTRVISIWGATHPYCGFRGWRQTDADTIQLALTCRPCSVYGNKPCARGDYRCLAAITPAVIASRLR